MKKLLLLTFLNLSILNVYAQDIDTQVLTVDKCPQQVLEAIIEGNLGIPLQVRKGDRIKFSMHTEGNFLEIEGGSASFYVTFHDDFMMKKTSSGLLFSQDTIHWQNFDHFFQGNLFFSLFGNEENHAEGAAVLKIDLAS